jgi:Fe2+ transport system protein B
MYLELKLKLPSSEHNKERAFIVIVKVYVTCFTAMLALLKKVSMKETFRICDQSVYNAEYTYLETVICGK